MVVSYTKQDCISAIEEAAVELGKSPSKKEFNDTDISPSASTIVRRFGSWDEAKEKSSVETYSKKKYSKEDCIKAIEAVADDIGKSPTYSEYQQHDTLPSTKVIVDRFGSWNKAKKHTSCELIPREHYSIDSVPDRSPHSQEEWENMTDDRRQVWRKRMYVEDIKMSRGCNRCGYDEFAASLSFHHTNPSTKDRGVSELVQSGKSYETIDAEVEKCEVLCANCHMVVEYSR